MSHTPGPWYCTASSPEGFVYSSDHELIMPWSPLLSDERKMANARLIAAAPELYTQLVGVRNYLQMLSAPTHTQGEQFFSALQMINALLAKIEGQ